MLDLIVIEMAHAHLNIMTLFSPELQGCGVKLEFELR